MGPRPEEASDHLRAGDDRGDRPGHPINAKPAEKNAATISRRTAGSREPGIEQEDRVDPQIKDAVVTGVGPMEPIRSLGRTG